MVTIVCVVSTSILKAPPGTTSPYISLLTPSGQRNCPSWASQPQKSVTLPPQPGGEHESSYEHLVALKKNHLSLFMSDILRISSAKTVGFKFQLFPKTNEFLDLSCT